MSILYMPFCLSLRSCLWPASASFITGLSGTLSLLPIGVFFCFFASQLYSCSIIFLPSPFIPGIVSLFTQIGVCTLQLLSYICFLLFLSLSCYIELLSFLPWKSNQEIKQQKKVFLIPRLELPSQEKKPSIPCFSHTT